ncbi:MAG: tetratricopeptide repeat protein [Chloroflexota bacterium]
MDTTMSQAQRMSAPRAIALCQCFNGALEFQAGHWQQAEEALRESIALYKEIGAASGEALARQRLGVVLTAQGRLDEALTILEEAIVVAERAVMRAHCLARLYAAMARNRLAAGDLGAADHALYLGLSMSERHGNCTTCDALLLPAAVSVRVAQNELAEAAEFCRQLEQEAAGYGSQTWIAMARQARGELAAAREEHEAALEAFEEAEQGFRQAGFDYEAARCLSAAADVRRQRAAPGDREKATEAQQEAERIYEALQVAA